MKRGKPLERRTPLKAQRGLQGGGGLRRETRVRPRSQKREEAMVERRALVKRLLAERPVCEIQVRCSGARAVDVHERLKRSRGGDILDPIQAHMVTACRSCHEWTENPGRDEPNPTALRMLLPSWHLCPPVGPC